MKKITGRNEANEIYSKVKSAVNKYITDFKVEANEIRDYVINNMDRFINKYGGKFFTVDMAQYTINRLNSIFKFTFKILFIHIFLIFFFDFFMLNQKTKYWLTTLSVKENFSFSHSIYYLYQIFKFTQLIKLVIFVDLLDQ